MSVLALVGAAAVTDDALGRFGDLEEEHRRKPSGVGHG